MIDCKHGRQYNNDGLIFPCAVPGCVDGVKFERLEMASIGHIDVCPGMELAMPAVPCEVTQWKRQANGMTWRWVRVWDS